MEIQIPDNEIHEGQKDNSNIMIIDRIWNDLTASDYQAIIPRSLVLRNSQPTN